MRYFIFGILALFLSVVTPAVFAETLDINTATAEQFDQVLVGVGKAKAAAIVQDREKNGPFKSVDDLARVKGIGQATLEKNRVKISVGGAAAPAAPPSAAPAPPPSK
jgi:competence protein ComEA